MGVFIFGFILFFGVFILFPVYWRFIDSGYEKKSGLGFIQTFFDQGNFGEYQIFSLLEQIPIHSRVLTNLYLPKEDGTTTEVDVVLITSWGIHVFESKNYRGWIFGNESHRYWTQTFSYYAKYRFFNPIWQNQGHIRALKEILRINHFELFYSYIVFGNECQLKKITIEGQNVRVLYNKQILKALLLDLKANARRLSAEQIDQYYLQLKQFSNASDQVKKDHIKGIQEKVTTS